MKRMAMTFFVGLFLGLNSQAGLTDIQSRPLRVLDPGSQLYVTVEGNLDLQSYYQNGQSVIIGLPPFDENQPYCYFGGSSELPLAEYFSVPLNLNASEGGVISESSTDNNSKFRTSLNFSGPAGEIDIVCVSPSNGVFKETTIGEFENIFGIHLRLGKVFFGDAGIELRDPLSDHDVLTPNLLRKDIVLKTQTPLKLIDKDNSNFFEVTISKGQVIGYNYYEGPYCMLFIEQDENGKDIEIPKNTEFRFTGSIEGSYTKTNTLDSFILMSELSGFDKPISIYCSSNDANMPLRYKQARQITAPVIDWIYTY